MLLTTGSFVPLMGIVCWLAQGDSSALDAICIMWVPVYLLIFMLIVDAALSASYLFLFLAPLRETHRLNAARQGGHSTHGGAVLLSPAPAGKHSRVASRDSSLKKIGVGGSSATQLVHNQTSADGGGGASSGDSGGGGGGGTSRNFPGAGVPPSPSLLPSHTNLPTMMMRPVASSISAGATGGDNGGHTRGGRGSSASGMLKYGADEQPSFTSPPRHGSNRNWKPNARHLHSSSSILTSTLHRNTSSVQVELVTAVATTSTIATAIPTAVVTATSTAAAGTPRVVAAAHSRRSSRDVAGGGSDAPPAVSPVIAQLSGPPPPLPVSKLSASAAASLSLERVMLRNTRAVCMAIVSGVLNLFFFTLAIRLDEPYLRKLVTPISCVDQVVILLTLAYVLHQRGLGGGGAACFGRGWDGAKMAHKFRRGTGTVSDPLAAEADFINGAGSAEAAVAAVIAAATAAAQAEATELAAAAAAARTTVAPATFMATTTLGASAHSGDSKPSTRTQLSRLGHEYHVIQVHDGGGRHADHGADMDADAVVAADAPLPLLMHVATLFVTTADDELGDHRHPLAVPQI